LDWGHVPRGDRKQLLPSVQAELGVDVAQVVFHGLAADEQLGRDLGVGQSLAGQVSHFGFPAGQRQGGVVLRRGTGKIAGRQLFFGAGDERLGAQRPYRSCARRSRSTAPFLLPVRRRSPPWASSSRAVQTGLYRLVVSSARW
jgi:hypothetical protein